MPIPNGGIVRHFIKVNRVLVAVALAIAAPREAVAQKASLRVVGSDSAVIPYATVMIDGAPRVITDEKGELAIPDKHKSVKVEVRRVGYKVWEGVVSTAEPTTIVLANVDQGVDATAAAMNRTLRKNQLERVGFYMRWIQKQRDGMRDATFIGPEAIEARQASVTTELLDRALGVVLRRDSKGVLAATGTGARPSGAMTNSGSSSGGSPKRALGGDGGGVVVAADRNLCYFSVLVDGSPVCANVGCHYVFAGDPPGSTVEDHSIDLDKLIGAKDIAAIEVYPRRDGMPENVLKAYEGCGVISIWTKGR
jgi:hypothetical protein